MLTLNLQILEKSGLEEKKILNLTVKEAVEIQKRILEELEEEKSKKDKIQYPIELKKKYFLNYKVYEQVFGSETINKVLEKIPFAKMTSEDWTLNESYFKKQGYLKIQEGKHKFSIPHGRASSFTREEYRYGYEYYVPSHYQSVFESKILKFCLQEKVGEKIDMNEFDIFSMNFSTDYIYLNVNGKDNLYIPIELLLKKDVDGIKKENLRYFNSYTGKDSSDYCNKMFESEKAKDFFSKLKE